MNESVNVEKKNRIKELIEILNEASKAYYQLGNEIMSNFEYDKLYDELEALEKETGIVFSNSPTINVGYEVISNLPKESHQKPMLSLDKTKEVGALEAFLNEKEGVLSWKLDGLTVVLTYNDGKLVKAVTRGNGEVGEVITPNAKMFKNIPLSIDYKGELVLRGEAVISYDDFEKINSEIDREDDKYKNPRNLCSGSVRQLNNQITKERNVKFFAFALVSATGVDFENSLMKQFEFLEKLGFEVVEHYLVDRNTISEKVKFFAKEIETFDIPSDGLVLIYEDIEYGISLGQTAKFPRNGIAFKWKDEIAVTKLKYIEWSPSRTGLINPVAVFEPVSLEGTTVSRASVHNVSIVEGLKLGVGDEIEVYKANMIIPQIAKNLTESGNVEIPSKCPVCGGDTKIEMSNEVKSLYCTNPLCQVKFVKKYAHFVSRDAFNIEGLSEETLEKFINQGFIKEYADIFKIERFKDQIVAMSGFGIKSYEKIYDAIQKSRKIIMPKFIYSLGIPNIGLANAKVICKEFEYDLEKIMNADIDSLTMIEGIGDVIAEEFVKYIKDEAHIEEINNLKVEIEFDEITVISTQSNISGKVFVITGSVNQYANRNELKDFIESLGGKVTGSVTGKTDYLINNDSTSNSSKNKKAKELGVAIITEQEFIDMAK